MDSSRDRSWARRRRIARTARQEWAGQDPGPRVAPLVKALGRAGGHVRRGLLLVRGLIVDAEQHRDARCFVAHDGCELPHIHPPRPRGGRTSCASCKGRRGRPRDPTPRPHQRSRCRQQPACVVSSRVLVGLRWHHEADGDENVAEVVGQRVRRNRQKRLPEGSNVDEHEVARRGRCRSHTQ